MAQLKRKKRKRKKKNKRFAEKRRLTLLQPTEAMDNAIISEPLPRMTVGFFPTSSRHAFSRNPEAPAATGSRTQGLPALLATSAANFMAGNQSWEMVPTLMQRARA
ncbi:hypothetical protein Tsubulata_029269 [Turnera subulata]|uniref:Uncharacterized protein n=1 Tax=Turnera subulata TaxID=218843 RepID=A0A9Q0JF08_9ROSI|nr:hypothetical protein Tsubulata_029269 [Turnera subulata]